VLRAALVLVLVLLSACTPERVIDGAFRGEEVEIVASTMFHWRSGLTDDEGDELSVDRLALSFSETEDLCDRQRGFLDDATDQEVPLGLDEDGYADHADLFAEHFPVVNRWDLTFWIGLPDGAETAEGMEVDLAESFDDTYLNAEAIASRWHEVPPGDLLTWRSTEWYGEYGEAWTSVSGTVRLDTFTAGERATGTIDAVFEDEDGETAEIDVTFDVGACFGSAG
jgi:hypothetical protein